MSKTIVFIHGAWLNSRSWETFILYFKRLARGRGLYRQLAARTATAGARAAYFVGGVKLRLRRV